MRELKYKAWDKQAGENMQKDLPLMSDFPSIRDVRAVANEKKKDFQWCLARQLLEQKLPGLLELSDFGEMEVDVKGVTYIATVNNKSICCVSGKFDIQVDGIIFTITVNSKEMNFAQARINGTVPKWKL